MIAMTMAKATTVAMTSMRAWRPQVWGRREW
jgi:hypothetical protein